MSSSMARCKQSAVLLYTLNMALLATHEIDSAYWHEWKLFHLPGGVQLFLILNFILLSIVFYGFIKVVKWEPGARTFSLLLACAGVFAFVIHMTFIASGFPEFRNPTSLGLLLAILLVSAAQLLVLIRLNRIE